MVVTEELEGVPVLQIFLVVEQEPEEGEVSTEKVSLVETVPRVSQPVVVWSWEVLAKRRFLPPVMGLTTRMSRTKSVCGMLERVIPQLAGESGMRLEIFQGAVQVLMICLVVVEYAAISTGQS